MLVLVRAHFLDRSVTPVAADVDLSSEVHHQSRIAYIGIGFERWFIQILKISQISRSRRFKKITHHIMRKDRYFESLTFGLSST
ncbi:hypothetical protein T12_12343 [Trichinella patagoniensis]|uniref:Uncharacterized protein n=1 Tax=Trichinella patagoniensis TaxID=990121 RepID=A0A0V0ZRL6_9BILA|nr:hypothetical protein T12_12343 [Trichinella patagoniensis]